MTRPDDLTAAELPLLDALGSLEPGPGDGDRDRPLAPGSDLTGRRLDALLDAQLASRNLDHAARWLRGRGLGFYTIGSSGHEGNAVVAAVLRPTDPALLHYRSGGFYLARAQQVPGHDGIDDVLRGLLAAADEPIAGGRHKVFGHHDLAVIPQTSTIASHLPRAVGVAYAIGRDRGVVEGSSGGLRGVVEGSSGGLRGVVEGSSGGLRGRGTQEWEPDAVAVCTFGDASLNHSTTQGALNAAGYFGYRGTPLPVLFVCEDNGLGISVPSPEGWVGASLRGRAGLRYEFADSCDPVGLFDAAEDLADYVRSHGRPAVLHVRCVRFGGHAGTDVESSYRSARSLRADLDADPIVATARTLVAAGLATADEMVGRALGSRDVVRAAAESLIGVGRLGTAAQVTAPLAPRRPGAVRARVVSLSAAAGRGDDPGALTLAESINRTLGDLLVADPGTLVFGEDVGVKGGVYGVTRGLQRAAGGDRVFDTLLDEQTILGLALGSAVSGLLPIPEIQYLAYVHNAIDQLRGEAATLSFFSQGQYTNGMVVRIAGYAYQKGFGGHFHNDNSLGGLRDLPGVAVASPATGADAAAMLRTCAAAARTDGTVSVFLEPIALYHTRDLYTEGDGAWLSPYTPAAEWATAHVPIGSGRVAREPDGVADVLIVTWGNGLYLSLRVAAGLQREGIGCRVYDLRWLAPLPIDDVVAQAQAVGRVVVVDETRHQGGAGEAVVSGLTEQGFRGPLVRVAAHDSFVPLGDAANLVLVSEDDIADAVRRIARS